MAPKIRIPVPENIKSELAYNSDNTCCICQYRDRPLQVHHIDEDPSCNEVDNLVLLCLDCHNKTQIKGGFGKKISQSDVIKFRNTWYKRVEKIRLRVDDIEVERKSYQEENIEIYEFGNGDKFENENLQLVASVLSIRSRYIAVRKQAQFLYDVGDTYNVRNGTAIEIEGLYRILNDIKRFYPKDHFLELDEETSNIKHMMWEWAYKISAPYGMAEAGTIIHAEAALIFMNFLKFKINALVNALLPECGMLRSEWEKNKFSIP